MKKILVGLLCVIAACSGANGGDDLFKPNPSVDAGEQKDSSQPAVDASTDKPTLAEDAGEQKDSSPADIPDVYVPPVPDCVPATDKALCVVAGKDCGVISALDNCGTARNPTCGPSDCGKGASCTANKCTACKPKTCASLNFTCGQADDGCNPAPLECGNCAVGNTCQANVCAPIPVCVPKTCIGEGLTCGSLSNGCGKVENCGVCAAGNFCSASPGVCKTYSQLCDAAPKTYLGSCTRFGSPTLNDVACSITWTVSRITSYADNYTALPARAQENTCVQNNVARYNCSGDRFVDVAISSWSAGDVAHPGSNGGCKVGYAGGDFCSESITWYESNYTALQIQGFCSVLGGTFVNP